MTSQYIYLLQEQEFVNTKENVYKVGMTNEENCERFNQFPKSSVLLFQMICNNCKNMEKIVLKKFKETFKQRKDIGNECFEGEYKIMINIIYLTIKDESNIHEEIINDQGQEKMSKIFSDYKNDESFGGNKKYIKISIIDDDYIISYINPKLMEHLHDYINECESIFDDYIIIEYEMNKNVADRLQYFNKLISKETLSLDKIYDINSINFINKINKTKNNIKVENYDDFQTPIKNDRFYCKITERIRQLFQCNTIINTSLYSTMVKEQDETDDNFNKFTDFDNFRIDVGLQDYKIIRLYKINSKYYDYETFLRKYIPYLICWDISNNYYIVNRDYEYIGLNSNFIDYIRGGQEYLFNDGNKPWDNIKNYIRFCNEYKKIINDNSLKECLNMHNSIKTILTLLD